jgi:ABC-type antimicrobial peptide transport system ATPase subunit
MTARLGYVVAEVNQASHQAERLTTDDLHWDQEWAEEVARMYRDDARERGRRERYIVCEVVPVEDAS